MKTIEGRERIYAKAMSDANDYQNISDHFGVSGIDFDPAISVQAQTIADALKRLAEKFQP